jgi:curved DNA-binding protein
MEYKDYYKTMGVARGASQDEIQRAHRKLARKYHPDVSKEPNAEALFKDVGEAYKVLKDPQTRAAYDELGEHYKAGQEFHAPPDWNAGFETSGRGFSEDEARQQSDFFESLFGHRGGGRGGSARNAGGGAGTGSFHFPGEDRHATIQIDLEDAYRGATRKISLRIPEADAQGQMTLREHQIEFVVPRGVRAGQRIRLAGQGAPGAGNGAPGDLYLEVEFRPHAHYRVELHDVYLDLPVAPWEATLGAEIEVPTPSGAVELKIPAGSTAERVWHSCRKSRLHCRRLLLCAANFVACRRHRAAACRLARHGGAVSGIQAAR